MYVVIFTVGFMGNSEFNLSLFLINKTSKKGSVVGFKFIGKLYGRFDIIQSVSYPI